ncbi:MAG: hypothetical protein OXH00_02640 [Candidatus Poribacteria bacterium]|nr:hypothetical protein [Candidatus Poribacteria bacterium]
MPVFGVPTIFEGPYKDVHDDPIVALGGCFMSNVDDVLMTFVRFSEDVEEGDAIRTKYDHLAPADNAANSFRDANDEIVPAGSTYVDVMDANFLTALAGIPDEPTLRDYAKIAIRSGDGAGQRGYITHYTNTRLNVRWYDTDDGTLKTAIGNDGNSGITSTSLFSIYAPWYVERAFSDAANATEGTVNGIVLARSAKANQYGFVGVEGDFPVKVNVAVDAGDILIPALTASQGEGETPAAADVIDAYATVQHAGVANTLVEATVYCRKISIVREIAESLVRGFDRPEAV